MWSPLYLIRQKVLNSVEETRTHRSVHFRMFFFFGRSRFLCQRFEVLSDVGGFFGRLKVFFPDVQGFLDVQGSLDILGFFLGRLRFFLCLGYIFGRFVSIFGRLGYNFGRLGSLFGRFGSIFGRLGSIFGRLGSFYWVWGLEVQDFWFNLKRPTPKRKTPPTPFVRNCHLLAQPHSPLCPHLPNPLLIQSYRVFFFTGTPLKS